MTSVPKRILVTSAGGGASNNLIDGLRHSVTPVFLIGTSSDQYALTLSRADRNYLIPPARETEAYVDALNHIVAREGIDLIIPNNDVEVTVVSEMRNLLGAPTYLPVHETIVLCQDKLLLTQHLASRGINVAETHAINSAEQAEEVFAQFGDPEVLWCRMRQGGGSKGSLPVNRPDLVATWVRYWKEIRGVSENMFVLCEYLPGRDFAIQSLWHNGELVQAKSCERVSYLFGSVMPSGSSSTPRVARLLDDHRINDLCLDTVRAIDPQATGLFCIDVKENSKGVPCVTEINAGRFFMITPVFNSVGDYNMAELYVRWALGQPSKVPVEKQFGDIGCEETFLVREVDSEPEVITADQVRSRYRDVMSSGTAPLKG